MPGPAPAWSEAEQSCTSQANLSRNIVPPPCQGRGNTPALTPTPRKFSHGRRRKGSCQLEELNTEGSIGRVTHSSNLRPGREEKKKKNKSWNPLRLVFFLLPKLLLGMEGGRKGEGLHDTKETAQSRCQLGALELVSCRSRQGWGLSSDPKQMSESDPFKAICSMRAKHAFRNHARSFLFVFHCIWEEGAKTIDKK